jgi:hypothetical protein
MKDVQETKSPAHAEKEGDHGKTTILRALPASDSGC